MGTRRFCFTVDGINSKVLFIFMIDCVFSLYVFIYCKLFWARNKRLLLLLWAGSRFEASHASGEAAMSLRGNLASGSPFIQRSLRSPIHRGLARSKIQTICHFLCRMLCKNKID